MSVSYFENRQDRYILIEDCDEIANFFADLVEVVSSFSFQLQVACTFGMVVEVKGSTHSYIGDRFALAIKRTLMTRPVLS